MSPREISVWVLFIAGGYLLGGIMFSRTIPMVLLHKDICAVSADHNPGASNVFASCGIPCGCVCLGLDVLKGFLPVFIACHCLDVTSPLFAAVLLAPVLGHATAPFYHFHGGKCIATAFGSVLALLPVTPVAILTLAILYILFSTVIKINPHRKRSILVFSLFAVIAGGLIALQGYFSVAAGCVLLALVAIAKHTKIFCCE